MRTLNETGKPSAVTHPPDIFADGTYVVPKSAMVMFLKASAGASVGTYPPVSASDSPSASAGKPVNAATIANDAARRQTNAYGSA